MDTLVVALYVTVDDLLVAHPDWAPERPAVGIAPKLSDAELVASAVLSVLLGFDSERRFVRWARANLRAWFPYLPGHAGYNKRLRRSAEMLRHAIGALGRDCPAWCDDVWLVDSTPVPCGRSRATQQRSDLAGWAEYGYSASRSRWFWGLRLHLLATPAGLPVAFALAGAKADERETCLGMIARGGPARPGQTLLADKGYRSAAFEAELAAQGITLIRPATRTEPPRPGERFLRPLRQIIESIIGALKDQLGLERHRARSPAGVWARVLQRLLALTAVVWHNQTTQQPRPARGLLAYDH
ncbi:MAG: IS982 family transposase [bacterium]|nr:IS982 family transposase [bacterium]